MKNLLILITALSFLSLPMLVFAEEMPMSFPMIEGSNAEAHKHNEEGIMHYNKGNFEEALKHFSMASKIDSGVGESHFNEALCLDKIGKHGDATMHFKAAKKNAHGNDKIINSAILNEHIGM